MISYWGAESCIYRDFKWNAAAFLNQILMVTDVHALGESFISFINICGYTCEYTSVGQKFSKNDPGRKSRGKKRRTEESQPPATQGELQAPEVSEEPEVTEEKREASQEMPPSTTQASSQPTKRR